jgi:hypothetical protein
VIVLLAVLCEHVPGSDSLLLPGLVQEGKSIRILGLCCFLIMAYYVFQSRARARGWPRFVLVLRLDRPTIKMILIKVMTQYHEAKRKRQEY